MPDRNGANRASGHSAKPGWKLRFESRFGLLDPIQILVFRSFGTPDALHIRGRVIEKKGLEGTTEESSIWRNIASTLHRLESDEIPGAHLRAHFQDKQWNTTTDREGYFQFDLDPVPPLPPGWHEVELELVESVGKPEQRFVRGAVLVPSPDAEFAVISDVDDTVIKTHNTDLLQEIAITFGKGARERKPFPGVPAFYRALSRGPDDQGGNPIFYVSKSGWNLYDLLDEFMDLNDIPVGPLFLSDLHIIEDRSVVLGSEHHKRSSIDLLLRTYPDLPFILIGDSGMHDPELYRQIVETHPGRIKAIYIHDVSPAARDQEVEKIAEELAGLGVPMLRAEDTVRTAEHAAENGYISQKGLEEVRGEVEQQGGT